MVSSVPSSPLLSVSKETGASPWCGGGDGYGSALLAVCDQASPSKPRLMRSERHTNTESADVRAATLGASITVNDRQEVMHGRLFSELCRIVAAARRLSRSCSGKVTVFSRPSSLHSVFSGPAFVLASRVWSGFFFTFARVADAV